MTEPIFICYRREDSSPFAGRLRDLLATTFSERTAFLDHSSIAWGDPWPIKLRKQLEGATIVIAIVGPHWVQAADEWGLRRIDDENDWVRQELEGALSKGKRLLPVLVGGAKLPPPEKVPPSVRPLLNCQALELREAYWDHDVKLLLEGVKKVLTPDQLRNLKRGPYPVPPSGEPTPVSEAELDVALKGTLKHWTVVPSRTDELSAELCRKYEFRSFRQAVGFMYQLAPGCDIAIHHPRWQNVYRELFVYLTTWSIGDRISNRDLQLAEYFEQAYDDRAET